MLALFRFIGSANATWGALIVQIFAYASEQPTGCLLLVKVFNPVIFYD